MTFVRMSTICALSSLRYAQWGKPSPAAWHHLLSNLLGYLVFHPRTAFGQRRQAVGTGTGHFLAVSSNLPHQKSLLFLVPVLAVNFSRMGTICSSISKTISPCLHNPSKCPRNPNILVYKLHASDNFLD